MVRTWTARTLLAIALVVSAAVAGETLGAGDELPVLGLEDQHDQPLPIDETTKIVLFTRDMDASDFVKEELAEDGAAKLQAARAVFVADISRMPSIITKIFALPSLRKRPYRMALDRDGDATSGFPANDGQVTVLHLDNRAIARIEFATSKDQVGEILRSAGQD
jgi:hypothetical protein